MNYEEIEVDDTIELEFSNPPVRLETAVTQPPHVTWASRAGEWLNSLRHQARAIIAAKLAALFSLGVAAGLVYGWIIDPVQWTGATLSQMPDPTKIVLVESLADLTAYNPNSLRLAQVSTQWDAAEMAYIACWLRSQGDDDAAGARFEYVAVRLTGANCDQ